MHQHDGSRIGYRKILGTSKCDVTQTMSQSQLGSTWGAVPSNGKPPKKLKTIATWVTAPTPKSAPTIFYDVYPQEDLGSYLLNGMNMSDAIYGPSSRVEFGHRQGGESQSDDHDGFSTYDALHVNSVKFGSVRHRDKVLGRGKRERRGLRREWRGPFCFCCRCSAQYFVRRLLAPLPGGRAGPNGQLGRASLPSSSCLSLFAKTLQYYYRLPHNEKMKAFGIDRYGTNDEVKPLEVPVPEIGASRSFN